MRRSAQSLTFEIESALRELKWLQLWTSQWTMSPHNQQGVSNSGQFKWARLFKTWVTRLSVFYGTHSCLANHSRLGVNAASVNGQPPHWRTENMQMPHRTNQGLGIKLASFSLWGDSADHRQKIMLDLRAKQVWKALQVFLDTATDVAKQDRVKHISRLLLCVNTAWQRVHTHSQFFQNLPWTVKFLQ